MAVMNSTRPARPFTVKDLEEISDDGFRYELIDGELFVSPVPGWKHGEASGTLYMLLRQAAPDDMRVIHAPYGVQPDKVNEVQPDVLVARFADMRD